MNVFQMIAVYFSYSFVRYAFIAGVLTALCASVLGVTLVLKRYSLSPMGFLMSPSVPWPLLRCFPSPMK